MHSALSGDPVVLASKSPRRKELLSGILLDFLTVAVEVDELLVHADGTADLALKNAQLKAETVSEKYPDAWVIGSDTVVSCDGESLGKPESKTEAFRMMRRLSGRSHEVYSAVCLIHHRRGIKTSFVEESQVRFFELSDEKIQGYVDAFDPTEYAGGYPIQHVMGSIVSGFSGSYCNIVGLPVERVRQVMLHRGIIQPSEPGNPAYAKQQ
jgi:septum formation protein